MEDHANTPDEIVDVVDESDQVIGQATKGEVNSNPKLIHREVGILICDDQGRVLLQQRSHMKKQFPLWWIISAAGHVPTGMTVEESAHKELKEELGFDTQLVQYEKMLCEYDEETFFASAYLGKIPNSVEINFDKEEIEQVKFVNEEELNAMIAADEKIEEYSLIDFRRFFRGEFDHLIKG